MNPRRAFRFTVAAAAVTVLVARTVLAHDPGLSTGQLRVRPDKIEAELTFARADIETLVKLDADGDGKVSEAEWSAAQPKLAEIARTALNLRVDDKAVAPDAPKFRLDETNNFHLTAAYPAHLPKQLSVHSTLIKQMPRGHRQFVSLHDEKGETLAEVLLSAEQDVIDVDMEKLFEPESPAPTKHTFRDFLKLGIEHIVTGYDHLLFLFALLIVVPGFRQAAIIITCFTIAHSVTLGLATLNVVTMPSRIVEPLIAVTIVYVGAENLVRRDGPRGRWLLTFAFGLIHGFGFASVLRELGVSSGTTGIAMPLFSFNLGVEVGQITIAAVMLPAILALRKHPLFVRRWVPACSTVVILLGTWWLLQRTVLS
ncbi:MAG TPA: HupE/UreJ family protein [Verrucomicrobiae bacterium]